MTMTMMMKHRQQERHQEQHQPQASTSTDTATSTDATATRKQQRHNNLVVLKSQIYCIIVICLVSLYTTYHRSQNHSPRGGGAGGGTSSIRGGDGNGRGNNNGWGGNGAGTANSNKNKKTKKNMNKTNNKSTAATSTSTTTAATTITQNSEQQHKHKQLFVIHGGPYKTGSTTIQCVASQLENEFLMDNFVFLGIDREYKQCGVDITTDTTGLLLPPFLSPDGKNKQVFGSETEGGDDSDSKLNNIDNLKHVVEYYRQQGKSIFISDEMLGDLFRNNAKGSKDNLIQFFHEISQNWTSSTSTSRSDTTAATSNVRFIINYRRYHDRLPSVYSQWYTGNHIFNPNRKKTVQSFPSFYRLLHESRRFNITHMIYEWKNEYPTSMLDMKVFNMHHEYNSDDSSSDMNENFFCETIPEATNVCSTLRQHRIQRQQQRVLQKEQGQQQQQVLTKGRGGNGSGLVGIDIPMNTADSKGSGDITQILYEGRDRRTTTTATNGIQWMTNQTELFLLGSNNPAVYNDIVSLTQTKLDELLDMAKKDKIVGDDILYECLTNEELDEFLKLSIQHELEMLSNPYYQASIQNEEDEEKEESERHNQQHQQLDHSKTMIIRAYDEIKRGFYKNVQKKKYCSINVKWLFDTYEKEWYEFFQNLYSNVQDLILQRKKQLKTTRT